MGTCSSMLPSKVALGPPCRSLPCPPLPLLVLLYALSRRLITTVCAPLRCRLLSVTLQAPPPTSAQPLRACPSDPPSLLRPHPLNNDA